MIPRTLSALTLAALAYLLYRRFRTRERGYTQDVYAPYPTPPYRVTFAGGPPPPVKPVQAVRSYFDWVDEFFPPERTFTTPPPPWYIKRNIQHGTQATVTFHDPMRYEGEDE